MTFFNDLKVPSNFLRSFFPSKTAFTEYVSIQVRRNYENVAVDVQRGTRGNLNLNTKSTEKIFTPPYYEELKNMTEVNLYDRLVGSADISMGEYTQLMDNMLLELSLMRNKIERAYEKQCAEILNLGTVTTQFADSIDYRRKAASMVDPGTGNYWADSGVNPFPQIGAMAEFIRTVGKSSGNYFNLLLGNQALYDLQANAEYQKRVTMNLNNNIDDVFKPQMDASGGTPHGVLSVGPWRIALWSYPEYYDVNGVATPYLDKQKVTMLPVNPEFNMMFAAVPQVLVGWNATNGMPQVAEKMDGAYIVDNYPDIVNSAHWLRVKSAGLAVPVAVDRMATRKVVADS
jgi:hypothetical protein